MKIENNKINEASRLLRKCNLSLSQVCEDIQDYLKGVPEAELHQNLMPPAYLELVRRRDNLVGTIVALAGHVEKDVEARTAGTLALLKLA